MLVHFCNQQRQYYVVTLEWFRSQCVNTATLSNQTLSCVKLTRSRHQLHLLSCHLCLAWPKVCATKMLKTQVLPTLVQQWRELTDYPWKPHPLLQRENTDLYMHSSAFTPLSPEQLLNSLFALASLLCSPAEPHSGWSTHSGSVACSVFPMASSASQSDKDISIKPKFHYIKTTAAFPLWFLEN